MQKFNRFSQLLGMGLALGAVTGCASNTVAPTTAKVATAKTVVTQAASCQTISNDEVARLFDRWNAALQSLDPARVAANYGQTQSYCRPYQIALALPQRQSKTILHIGLSKHLRVKFCSATSPQAAILRQIRVCTASLTKTMKKSRRATPMCIAMTQQASNG